MRNILFRGKRKDNGKWVQGDFCKPCNIVFEEVGFDVVLSRGNIPITQDYKVIPETVGQYTGLKDKNGKKIFEGDIANFKRFDINHVGKIVFNQKTAGFEFWWIIIAGAYGEKATRVANLSVCNEIEVIGNIYDNPELLEGEQ